MLDPHRGYEHDKVAEATFFMQTRYTLDILSDVDPVVFVPL